MADQNINAMAVTWNDGATTFSAVKMTVTDTASNAASNLLELLVGSARKFEVRKGGSIYTYNSYTDASNYERAFIGWDASEFIIESQAAGTGSRLPLEIIGPEAGQRIRMNDGLGDMAIGWHGGRSISFQDNGANRYSMSSAAFYPRIAGIELGLNANAWTRLWLRDVSSDPADPNEGHSALWQSNGVGSGDDGDIMMKITAGGVTKTVTLVDFSAA